MSMEEMQNPQAEPLDHRPAADVPQNDAPQEVDHGTVEDEAAAFAEGFAQARTTDDHPSSPEGGQTETHEAAIDAAQAALAGLSSDQLKALLARVPDVERKLEAQMQKVTGKLGEFNRTLQQLQSSSRQPGGAAYQIAADKLKRTREMYPDLADAIASDLAEVFNGATIAGATPEAAASGQPAQPVQSGPTPEQIARFVEAKTQEAQQAMARRYEERMLTQRHPDWVETARTPDFKLWAETLPAKERQMLLTSEDALFVAQKLDAYKAARAQQHNSRTNTRRRLEQAVVPTASSGAGASTLSQTEEDAFLAGFARARTG